MNMQHQGEQEFAMHVATANGTSWGSLKDYILKTEAHVVLGQEVHIKEAEVNEASEWAFKRGWKSVWSPAEPGQGERGTTGGVVILARSWLGLMEPPGQEAQVCPSRAVAAVLEAPGSRQIQLYSIYLHHGEGLSERNLGVLRDVGAHASVSGRLLIIGGDFNLEPCTLLESEFPQSLAAELISTGGPLGTCKVRGGNYNIDFFVVDGSLAKGVRTVQVDAAAGLTPHSPVDLVFSPEAHFPEGPWLR